MPKKADKILIVLSVIAAIISAIVSVTQKDVFGLAGTQWILVAIILGVYGLYAGKCSCNSSQK